MKRSPLLKSIEGEREINSATQQRVEDNGGAVVCRLQLPIYLEEINYGAAGA